MKEFLVSCTQDEINNLLKKKQLNSLEELAEYTDFSIEELQEIYNNGAFCKAGKIKGRFHAWNDNKSNKAFQQEQ